MIFEYTDMNHRTATADTEQYGNLIIATELATNEGASVTNSAEYIATQYAGRHNIPLDAIKFVERYDSRSYDDKRTLREPSYSLVSFVMGERNGKPHLTTPEWKHLTEDELQDLISEHK